MNKTNEILQKAEKIFGTTNECLRSSFILQNGKILDIRNQQGYTRDHDAVYILYDDPSITKFISPSTFTRDANAIKMSEYGKSISSRNALSIGVDINITSDITRKQWNKLEECSCFYNLNKEKIIAFEFQDKNLNRITEDVVDEVSCFEAIKTLKNTFNKTKHRYDR